MVWQVEAGMVCRGNDRKGPVWQARRGKLEQGAARYGEAGKALLVMDG